jgi:hypothetical protein
MSGLSRQIASIWSADIKRRVRLTGDCYGTPPATAPAGESRMCPAGLHHARRGAPAPAAPLAAIPALAAVAWHYA